MHWAPVGHKYGLVRANFGPRLMRKRRDELGQHFGRPEGESGGNLRDIGLGFEYTHGSRLMKAALWR